MKRILFTGGTGFLGRNLVPKLREIGYDVFSPRREELNLKDLDAVESYLKENRFDTVIHAAIPNLVSSYEDIRGNLFKDSVLAFINLYRMQNYYEKMIYFGSGAEFNKRTPIISVKEVEFGRDIPEEEYGLAKYIMNCLCLKSKNIYNLRIFGCFGPTDAQFKLITNAIRCCLKKENIYLHQDCYFDYLYVDDIIPAVNFIIENSPTYHDFNLCSGRKYKISEICEIVKRQMHSKIDINIELPGMNNEYTGDNTRILTEIPGLSITSIEEGIKKQIEYERGVTKL